MQSMLVDMCTKTPVYNSKKQSWDTKAVKRACVKVALQSCVRKYRNKSCLDMRWLSAQLLSPEMPPGWCSSCPVCGSACSLMHGGHSRTGTAKVWNSVMMSSTELWPVSSFSPASPSETPRITSSDSKEMPAQLEVSEAAAGHCHLPGTVPGQCTENC